MGYLSEALVNYLVRLGWSYGDEEIFSIKDMIEKFNVENIGKSAAVFNPEKLLWLNAHYIRGCDIEKLSSLAGEFFEKKGYKVPEKEKFYRIIESLKPRCRTLVEFAEMGAVYFEDEFEYDLASINKFFPQKDCSILKKIKDSIANTDNLDESSFENMIKGIAAEFNVKVVLVAQQLRIALSGKTVSPGLFDVISVIGKERTLKRIERTLNFIV
jgi:glutamyl-tRNA synthetase